MSEDDGLREAIETGVLGFVWSTGDAAAVADVVLALPEVVALRAQAAAVQRVRELVEGLEAEYLPLSSARGQAGDIADRILAALDGDPS